MTPRQAALIIGCSLRRVRGLIREGKLRATLKTVTPDLEAGETDYTYSVWDIPRTEAVRFADIPQTRGYPRGRKRT